VVEVDGTVGTVRSDAAVMADGGTRSSTDPGTDAEPTTHVTLPTRVVDLTDDSDRPAGTAGGTVIPMGARDERPTDPFCWRRHLAASGTYTFVYLYRWREPGVRRPRPSSPPRWL
jgi:hypothetical protein